MRYFTTTTKIHLICLICFYKYSTSFFLSLGFLFESHPLERTNISDNYLSLVQTSTTEELRNKVQQESTTEYSKNSEPSKATSLLHSSEKANVSNNSLENNGSPENSILIPDSGTSVPSAPLNLNNVQHELSQETMTSSTVMQEGSDVQKMLMNNETYQPCANTSNVRPFADTLLESLNVPKNAILMNIGNGAQQNSNNVIPAEIFTITSTVVETTTSQETSSLSPKNIDYAMLLLSALHNNSKSVAKENLGYEILNSGKMAATSSSFNTGITDNLDRTSKREIKNNGLVDYTIPPGDLVQTGININQVQTVLPPSDNSDDQKQMNAIVLPEDLLDDFNIFNQFLKMLKQETVPMETK